MKIGFLTDYSPARGEFAAEAGFDCWELGIGLAFIEITLKRGKYIGRDKIHYRH